MSATTLPEPKPIPVNLDEHQNRMAEIRARQAKNREEATKCLDPTYAAWREHQKPRFKFTVTAAWLGRNDERRIARCEGKEVVVAQNEQDAWALFCNRLGILVGRSECIELIINQGPQVKAEDFLADGMPETTIPTMKMSAPRKAMKI